MLLFKKKMLRENEEMRSWEIKMNLIISTIETNSIIKIENSLRKTNRYVDLSDVFESIQMIIQMGSFFLNFDSLFVLMKTLFFRYHLNSMGAVTGLGLASSSSDHTQRKKQASRKVVYAFFGNSIFKTDNILIQSIRYIQENKVETENVGAKSINYLCSLIEHSRNLKALPPIICEYFLQKHQKHLNAKKELESDGKSKSSNNDCRKALNNELHFFKDAAITYLKNTCQYMSPLNLFKIIILLLDSGVQEDPEIDLMGILLTRYNLHSGNSRKVKTMLECFSFLFLMCKTHINISRSFIAVTTAMFSILYNCKHDFTNFKNAILLYGSPCSREYMKNNSCLFFTLNSEVNRNAKINFFGKNESSRKLLTFCENHDVVQPTTYKCCDCNSNSSSNMKSTHSISDALQRLKICLSEVRENNNLFSNVVSFSKKRNFSPESSDCFLIVAAKAVNCIRELLTKHLIDNDSKVQFYFGNTVLSPDHAVRSMPMFNGKITFVDTDVKTKILIDVRSKSKLYPDEINKHLNFITNQEFDIYGKTSIVRNRETLFSFAHEDGPKKSLIIGPFSSEFNIMDMDKVEVLTSAAIYSSVNDIFVKQSKPNGVRAFNTFNVIYGENQEMNSRQIKIAHEKFEKECAHTFGKLSFSDIEKIKRENQQKDFDIEESEQYQFFLYLRDTFATNTLFTRLVKESRYNNSLSTTSSFYGKSAKQRNDLWIEVEYERNYACDKECLLYKIKPKYYRGAYYY